MYNKTKHEISTKDRIESQAKRTLERLNELNKYGMNDFEMLVKNILVNNTAPWLSGYLSIV